MTRPGKRATSLTTRSCFPFDRFLVIFIPNHVIAVSIGNSSVSKTVFFFNLPSRSVHVTVILFSIIQICESLASTDDWEVIQPNPKAMGPYAFKGDQWVGYDDEDIVKLKAKYANEKSLGGIMFWTIDNDDFRGKCHDRPYPLIEAAKEALLTENT